LAEHAHVSDAADASAVSRKIVGHWIGHRVGRIDMKVIDGEPTAPVVRCTVNDKPLADGAAELQLQRNAFPDSELGAPFAEPERQPHRRIRPSRSSTPLRRQSKPHDSCEKEEDGRYHSRGSVVLSGPVWLSPWQG